MGPSKRKPAKTKQRDDRPAARTRQALEKQVARLEKLLDLVLQASLRGRLLPNERRTIKRHLDKRRVEDKAARERHRKQEGPRCPACRLPIPDEKAEKCPHCSVLLAVARRSSRRK